MIGTFRDSEVSHNTALSEALAALRREQGVERVALEGLRQQDVVELMEAAAGHEMDELGLALAGQIASETDGNPFFVAELLRHLIESDTLVRRDDGRWELKGGMDQLGLPQSVREVVGRRVERLGDQAVSVLSIAALIGREFDLDLLEGVVQGHRGGRPRHPRIGGRGVDPGRVRSPGGALLLRARPDLAHPLRGHRRHPPRPAAPAGGRVLGGHLRAGSRSPPGRAGPPLVGRDRQRRREQGGGLQPQGRRAGPGRAGAGRSRALVPSGARAGGPATRARPGTSTPTC